MLLNDISFILNSKGFGQLVSWHLPAQVSKAASPLWVLLKQFSVFAFAFAMAGC